MKAAIVSAAFAVAAAAVAVEFVAVVVATNTAVVVDVVESIVAVSAVDSGIVAWTLHGKPEHGVGDWIVVGERQPEVCVGQ